MREAARQSLRRSYRIYRCYRYSRLRWDYRGLHKKRPILVLQVGKVGSTAVLRALADQVPDRPAIHLHSLRPGHLRSVDRAARDLYVKTGVIQGSYLRTRYVSKHFKRLCKQGPIEIVTLVRDPASIVVSGFFQTLPLVDPALARRVASEEPSEELMESLNAVFNERAFVGDPFQWFEKQLHHFFDIDTLAESFDPIRGYRIYSGDQARVLLIRLEDLNRVFEPAMQDFIGRDGLKLFSANQADEKQYAAAYRLFRRRPLDENLLFRLYSSPWTRHFYTDGEIEAFRQQWS